MVFSIRQVMVIGPTPPGTGVMTDAIGNYITDVKNSDFPNENESY